MLNNGCSVSAPNTPSRPGQERAIRDQHTVVPKRHLTTTSKAGQSSNPFEFWPGR